MTTVPLLRVGIIGAGRWGTILATKLRDMEGFRVTNVYDADRAAAQRLAQSVGANCVSRVEYATHLADAVIIATPPSTHAEVFEVVSQTCERVRVEKPLATSYADALIMSMTARSRGVELTVGHTTCYQAATGSIRRLVRQDAGPIIYGRLCERGPAHEATTSPVWDLMCHDIAFHRLITHDDWTRNAPQVQAVGWHDDLWTARLSDGATFVASWNSDRRVRGVTGTGWAYCEHRRALTVHGTDYEYLGDDPLAAELESWRVGRGYPASFATDVVGVCSEVSARIERVRQNDGAE
jgi:predicted dehydrogenase